MVSAPLVPRTPHPAAPPQFAEGLSPSLPSWLPYSPCSPSGCPSLLLFPDWLAYNLPLVSLAGSPCPALSLLTCSCACEDDESWGFITSGSSGGVESAAISRPSKSESTNSNKSTCQNHKQEHVTQGRTRIRLFGSLSAPSLQASFDPTLDAVSQLAAQNTASSRGTTSEKSYTQNENTPVSSGRNFFWPLHFCFLKKRPPNKHLFLNWFPQNCVRVYKDIAFQAFVDT